MKKPPVGAPAVVLASFVNPGNPMAFVIPRSAEESPIPLSKSGLTLAEAEIFASAQNHKSKARASPSPPPIRHSREACPGESRERESRADAAVDLLPDGLYPGRSQQGLISRHHRRAKRHRLGGDEAVVHLGNLRQPVEPRKLRSAQVRQLYTAHGVQRTQQVGWREGLPKLYGKEVELGHGYRWNHDGRVAGLGQAEDGGGGGREAPGRPEIPPRTGPDYSARPRWVPADGGT